MMATQGELEHRRPKARFTRTDKKKFVKQMTRIERREARLRRIRANLRKAGNIMEASEGKLCLLDCHHHIGTSQHIYNHIGTFLRRNAGDPAIQVCFAWNYRAI